MELDLPNIVGLPVHSCAHWLRTCNPPPPPIPPHLGSYTRALLVSQDRLGTSLCDPLVGTQRLKQNKDIFHPKNTECRYKNAMFPNQSTEKRTDEENYLGDILGLASAAIELMWETDSRLSHTSPSVGIRWISRLSKTNRLHTSNVQIRGKNFGFPNTSFHCMQGLHLPDTTVGHTARSRVQK